MDELISVLIPTYNRRDGLIKAAKSCLSQTYKNLEIIITDNSDDCFRKDLELIFPNESRIRYYKNFSNIGPVLNWREAYNHVSGKYWILLPDDDYIINPFYFEDAIKILEENNEIGVVFTDCLLSYPDRVSVGDSRAEGKMFSYEFLEKFWTEINVPTIANVVRKASSDKVDFFLDNNILYSDIELWLKLSKITKFVYFYKNPSVNYIFGDDNIVFNMPLDRLISNSKFISSSVDEVMQPEYIYRYVLFVTGIYPRNKFKFLTGVLKENGVSGCGWFSIYIRFIIQSCKRIMKFFIKKIIKI